MSSIYYVPVYANWEGDILPVKLGKGTVAFYAPGFPKEDISCTYQSPAYWMAIQSITPVIYKNKYFVVLDFNNTIVEEKKLEL
jgi:hypothetical protein